MCGFVAQWNDNGDCSLITPLDFDFDAKERMHTLWILVFKTCAAGCGALASDKQYILQSLDAAAVTMKYDGILLPSKCPRHEKPGVVNDPVVIIHL